MSISDGQDVDAANSNAAWISRTTDSSTSGKLDLTNADAASGDSVTNVQRELNGVDSFITDSTQLNTAENRKPSWGSDSIGSANQGVKERIDSIQVVVEANQSNKVDKVTSTDDAIVRFDGTSGDVQNSGVTIDDSDNVSIPGNLTVTGSTTTIGAEVVAEDPNITLNDGGDQASADSGVSGFTVEMSDATNARFGYDSTLTSRFKAGEVGSESEIITAAGAQDISGSKTFEDALTMDEISTPSNPAAGENKLYFKADGELYKLDDTGSEVQLQAGAAGTGLSAGPMSLANLGMETTTAASARTFSLKQLNGSSDPAGSGGEVTVSFRSTTITSGAITEVEYDSATSVTIPSGATLGYQNGDDRIVYVYCLYDGTNKELAVSSRYFDEAELHSTTAISAAADDGDLYSTNARTGAALRLVARYEDDNVTDVAVWTNIDSLVVGSVTNNLRKSQFLGATSSLTSGTGASAYIPLTGNRIDLTPGVWRITGQGFIERNSGTSNATIMAFLLSESSNSFTDLGTSANVTKDAGLDGPNSCRIQTDTDQDLDRLAGSVASVRVTINASTPIYCNAFLAASNFAGYRGRTVIYAERIE